MRGEDPDHAARDLYEHIKSGKEAVWTFNVQVMPFAEAATYRYNILDITKVWPHADYPLIPFGRMVLNRNPENFFAEVEQVRNQPCAVAGSRAQAFCWVAASCRPCCRCSRAYDTRTTHPCVRFIVTCTVCARGTPAGGI